MSVPRSELAPLFSAVAEVLNDHRGEFNASDEINGNHGDHMVAIFQAASQAASLALEASLADAMQATGRQLATLPANGTAQVYARGLDQFSQQFRQRQITLAELVGYVQHLLLDADNPAPQARNNEVLKALTHGLAGWLQLEENPETTVAGSLDMGQLFELGMAYLQAKQRGGSKAEILAEAASLSSPLRKVPYRQQSGRLAIKALLEAMARSSPGLGL